MRMRRILLSIALLATTTPAAPRRFALHLPENVEVGARVGGARTVWCESRWHRGAFRARVRGSARVSLNALLPRGPVEVGQSWSLSSGIVALLAGTLVDTERDLPHEAEAWRHWTGNQPRGVRSKPTGRLTATLERVDARGVASVRVEGSVAIWQGGNMASRYGPNTWEVEWEATVRGIVHVDVERRRLGSAWLQVAGTGKGRYFNGRHVQEPYTAGAEIAVSVLRAAEPDERKAALAAIRDLSHDRVQVRAAAQASLTRAEYDVTPILKEALETVTDPESRRRLQRILERFGE
jgi:hypothetical protein